MPVCRLSLSLVCASWAAYPAAAVAAGPEQRGESDAPSANGAPEGGVASTPADEAVEPDATDPVLAEPASPDPGAPASGPGEGKASGDEPDAGGDSTQEADGDEVLEGEADPEEADAQGSASEPANADRPDADEFGTDEFGADELGADELGADEFGADEFVGDAAAVDDYDPSRDSPQALRARHWVRGGVVMLAAGGSLGLGALIMGLSDPCAKPAGNSCLPVARNRAALTMGVPGLVMVGGGVAALVVGIRRRKHLSIAPSVVRRGGRVTFAGLDLSGRF